MMGGFLQLPLRSPSVNIIDGPYKVFELITKLFTSKEENLLYPQNKTCVQTLEGHAQNIASVSFHPELPIILTGSEDGTVRVWHANTYRLGSIHILRNHF